jgi:hypothetical protein
MIPTSSRNPIPNLRQHLAPHLPASAGDAGNTIVQLGDACESFVRSAEAREKPALDPYGDQLHLRQKVDLSRDLNELSDGVQKDFEAGANSSAPLRLNQLYTSFSSLDQTATKSLEAAQNDKGDMKANYRTQVFKTMGWMTALAGSLAVGMVAPPLSVPLVAITAGLTIRSINKARKANKTLAQKLPTLEREIKEQSKLLDESGKYQQHIKSWDRVLASSAPPTPVLIRS